MVKTPCFHELLELRPAHDSNQSSRGKFRVVCALGLPHSIRVAFFRSLLVLLCYKLLMDMGIAPQAVS